MRFITVVPILALLVCAAGLWYLPRLGRRLGAARGAADLTSPGRKGRPPASAQSMLGFQDIREGILILPGGRYRLALEVLGSVNFHLQSAGEQDQVEASFRRLMASLSFPVQFYVQTRLLDVSAQAAQVLQVAGGLPETLRCYAEDYARHIAGWMAGRDVLVKRCFVVIPFDGPGDFAQAKMELSRRKELLERELQRWLGCQVLDTEWYADLLYVAFNKTRAAAAKMADAAAFGFLEPVVQGVSIADVRAETP